VRGQRRTLLRPRAAWIGPAARVAVRAVGDLAPLGRALWERGIRRRPGTGRLVEVPYAAVGDGPEAAAHRAFTQAIGSIAPNTTVVDVDRERGVVVVHQLVATDDPAAEAKPLPEP
jgi:hypothetical protein